MDIWRTHFLKILRVKKDFFRTIYHFCAFRLTPFPGVLMDVRQKKQDRIPRNSWCPPSRPGSRSWYWPGWQTQGSREKEISSHVNSKVFALWLAKYTFCPAEDSASSLPSRLTSGPVNTSFYSLSKLSVHIPKGLASFWKLPPLTWTACGSRSTICPLITCRQWKNAEAKERQDVASLRETPVSRDCVICCLWQLWRANWADDLRKESPRFTSVLLSFWAGPLSCLGWYPQAD